MLNLIVIYSKHLEKAVSFYELFGLTFKKEKNGNSPEHYACLANGLVFEIYPETLNNKADAFTKLGFLISDINNLKDKLTYSGFTYKENLDFLIIEDPDGRKILIQK